MKPADVRKQIQPATPRRSTCSKATICSRATIWRSSLRRSSTKGCTPSTSQSFYANEARPRAAAAISSSATLLAAARTLPMMAPRRVLIVHEAERLLSPRKGKDDETRAPRHRRASASEARRRSKSSKQYIEAPEPLTTLVFVAGALDANRRLVKLLRKHAMSSIAARSALDRRGRHDGSRRRLEKDGLGIEPQAMTLLLEATGLSLGRIRAEIDKLASLRRRRSGRDGPTRPRDGACRSPSRARALRWARRSGATTPRPPCARSRRSSRPGMQPVMVLGQIRAAARKLQPDSRAKSGLDAVFRTDLAIKSSAGEPRFLLERLVIELCAR